MDVTIYTKNNCPACKQSKAMLTTLGIEYIEKNIEEDFEAFKKIIQLNIKQVPVIETKFDIWSGHQPSKLMALKNK